MKKQTSKMILDVSKRLMKKYAFYFFIFNAINLNSFVSFYYLRTTCGVKGALITWGLTLQNWYHTTKLLTLSSDWFVFFECFVLLVLDCSWSVSDATKFIVHFHLLHLMLHSYKISHALNIFKLKCGYRIVLSSIYI